MSSGDFFRGKRITVMGLGLLGRSIQVIRFLYGHGAKLLVTDLKTRDELASSVEQLSDCPEIAYILGEHRREDFQNTDMVIRAPNAPLDSPYLRAAREAGVPIEMDASLFAKLCPKEIMIIGVTGTRGKSTVSQLVYEVIHAGGKRVYLGGNVQGGVTLPLLDVVLPGDTVVLELDSWQLQGFGDNTISPHISVFTSFMPDHLNYYMGDMQRYFEDKANIFRFQKKSDHLVVHESVFQSHAIVTQAMVHRVSRSDIPDSLHLLIRGNHNRENVACARKVAEILGIPDTVSFPVFERFGGLPGRMQVLGVRDSITYINDTNGTTPDAAVALMRAFPECAGKAIVIAGGADKAVDYTEWGKVISDYAKAITLFRGTASEKMFQAITKPELVVAREVSSMQEALLLARKHALPGDTIFLSPAAASFGVFAHEYERGERFNREAGF